MPSDATSSLVSDALAAAHTHISGEPQLLPTFNVPNLAEPSQLFLSSSLPIGSRLSMKVKAKIWNEEFIDFGTLFSGNSPQEKFQFSLQPSPSGGQPLFCLEPTTKPKKVTTIDVWLQAFHVFVGVYTQKYPNEAPALMKYRQTIQDLASRGQNWHFYDENFRFLRQTQRTALPWGSIHGELLLRSQCSMMPSQVPRHCTSLGSDHLKLPSIPTGYCFIFHRGQNCTGCEFNHACFKCNGAHRGTQCTAVVENFHPAKAFPKSDRDDKSKASNSGQTPTTR